MILSIFILVIDLLIFDLSYKNELDSESNGENLDLDFEVDDDFNVYFEDLNLLNDR